MELEFHHKSPLPLPLSNLRFVFVISDGIICADQIQSILIGTSSTHTPSNMMLRQETGGIAASPAPDAPAAGAVLRFYRFPGLAESARDTLLRRLRACVRPVRPVALDTEFCYYVELGAGVDPLGLSKHTPQGRTLRWLLAETFEPSMVQQNTSHFGAGEAGAAGAGGGCCGRENALLARCAEIAARDADAKVVSTVTEIGPRLSFTSAFSTNAVSICRACGLGEQIVRVERAVRYRVEWEEEEEETGGGMVKAAALAQSLRQLEAAVHDRMTQMVYAEPLLTFGAPAAPEPTQRVPVMEEGRAALERISNERGLAFDDWDLDFYTKLFRDEMRRNPTDVECFGVLCIVVLQYCVLRSYMMCSVIKISSCCCVYVVVL